MKVPSSRPARSGGWIHFTDGSRRSVALERSTRIDAPKISSVEWELIDKQCRADLLPDRLRRLAVDLGVTESSLSSLGIGWHASSRAYSFPMRSEAGAIIGMRLRTPEGRKRCIVGSRLGIVAPTWLNTPDDLLDADWLLITEGESDCAAALDLNFPAIARPGCQTCVDLIVRWIGRMRPARVAIMSDRDAPGLQGATRLAREISRRARLDCAVTIPPDNAKDLREWRRSPRASHDALLSKLNGGDGAFPINY